MKRTKADLSRGDGIPGSDALGSTASADAGQIPVSGNDDPASRRVDGDEMEGSLAELQRGCAAYIDREEREDHPDVDLIALLCEAVRCSRALAKAKR